MYKDGATGTALLLLLSGSFSSSIDLDWICGSHFFGSGSDCV